MFACGLAQSIFWTTPSRLRVQKNYVRTGFGREMEVVLDHDASSTLMTLLYLAHWLAMYSLTRGLQSAKLGRIPLFRRSRLSYTVSLPNWGKLTYVLCVQWFRFVPPAELAVMCYARIFVGVTQVFPLLCNRFFEFRPRNSPRLQFL